MRLDAVRVAQALALGLGPFEEVRVSTHLDSSDLVHLHATCSGVRGLAGAGKDLNLCELAGQVVCAQCAPSLAVPEPVAQYAKWVLRCAAIARRLDDAGRTQGATAVRFAALAWLGAGMLDPSDLGELRGGVDGFLADAQRRAGELLEANRAGTQGFCLWAVALLDGTGEEVFAEIDTAGISARLAPGRGAELLAGAHQAMRDGGMGGARTHLCGELRRLLGRDGENLAAELCTAWLDRLEVRMAASGQRVLEVRLHTGPGEVLTGPRVDLLALTVLLGQGSVGGVPTLTVVPGWVCELVTRWHDTTVAASDLGAAHPGDEEILPDVARLCRAGRMSAPVALALARKLRD